MKLVKNFKEMKGTIKWFNNKKGFGFITIKNKGDIFFHISRCISDIKEGDTVFFDIINSRKGKNAINICKEIDIKIEKRVGVDTTIIVDLFCNGKNISDLDFTKSISEKIKKELNAERVLKFEGISESGKAKIKVSCEDISETVFLSHHIDDEREILEKIDPEIIDLLEENEKKGEEERKKKLLLSIKEDIEFLKNDERNSIKKFLEEIKQVFDVKFPKTFEDTVDSISWGNQLHWDVSKKISSFTSIDEDIFISENDLFSESEDDSFETDDELLKLKAIRNKELAENRKLFNSVFDRFSTKVIIRDDKGETFEKVMIDKEFNETLVCWLIDWVDAIKFSDSSWHKKRCQLEYIEVDNDLSMKLE